MISDQGKEVCWIRATTGLSIRPASIKTKNGISSASKPDQKEELQKLHEDCGEQPQDET